MQMYDDLRAKGVESLELWNQNAVLVGAFSQKMHWVKKQVFMTLQFRTIYIDQIFLVSEQLMTPMLIGCDFCTTNGLILDFQRQMLSMKQRDQYTEVNFMNRQEEGRGGETSFAALRNRQAIALPTPLSDPGQLIRRSKPHSLKPLPCDNEPCNPDPNVLCKGKGNSYFYYKCLPNCAKNPLSKCNPVEGRNKGHVAHKVESEGDVWLLS